MASGARREYSTEILPTSMTFFQRASSAARNFSNCSGVLPTISKPCSTSLALMSGSLIAATIAACSLALLPAYSVISRRMTASKYVNLLG